MATIIFITLWSLWTNHSRKEPGTKDIIHCDNLLLNKPKLQPEDGIPIFAHDHPVREGLFKDPLNHLAVNDKHFKSIKYLLGRAK